MRTKNQTSPRRTKKGVTRTARALTLQRVPVEELRRLAKPHTGYEDFIDLFSKLVAKYGDELGVGIDAGAMRTAAKNAQSLKTVVADAAEQLALATDTQTVQDCTAWKEMMLIYGRAQQAGRTNSQIVVMIEPFMRFMKTGPRTKKSVATTPPAV